MRKNLILIFVLLAQVAFAQQQGVVDADTALKPLPGYTRISGKGGKLYYRQNTGEKNEITTAKSLKDSLSNKYKNTGGPITGIVTVQGANGALSLKDQGGSGNTWKFSAFGNNGKLRFIKEFGTGNANPLVIDVNGNVGVNQSAPAYPFEVGGNANIAGGDLRISAIVGVGGRLIMPLNAGVGKFLQSDASGIGTWATFPTQTNADWNSTSGVSLILNKPTLGSLAYLNSISLTGNVTGLLPDENIASATTWNAKISGSGTANMLAKFGSPSTLANSNIFDNSTQLGFFTATPASGTRFYFEIPDNLQSVVFRKSSGGLNNVGLAFKSKESTGVFDISTLSNSGSNLTFSNNGVEKVRIDNNGNVGIGTASPQSKLHIIGTLLIDDGTQATGKVFTSNSSGLGSWVNLPTQTNADWNSTSGVSLILNKPNLGSLAYLNSISFASLTGKPTSLSGYGIIDAYPLTGNPSGFLTGITSTNITTALGFTPYNATNPSGYISSVPAQSFASLTAKPTTLGGYGITDGYPLTGNPSGFLTGITSTNVTTALGYTPYNATNPNAYITSSSLSTYLTSATAATTYTPLPTGNNAKFGSGAMGTSTVGGDSGFGSNFGDKNTAIGYNALGALTTGYFNTAIGYGAGYTLTTGSNNLFIGRSLAGVTTGSGNVIIGNNNTSFPATMTNNFVALDGSGNEKFRVLDNGKFGIGTSSPSRLLDLVGTNEGIGITNIGQRTYYIGALGGAAATSLNIYDASAGADRWTLTSAGNIGIGTVSPANKLQVVGGNFKISNNYKIKFGDSADNDGFTAGVDASNNMTFTQANNAFLSFSVGFSSNAANVIKFERYGNESMRIDNSGNLGIGTTAPAQKLDVNGISQATQFKLSALNTAPSSATATGIVGEIRITAGFIYVCTATNTWVRSALATW